MDVPIIRRAVIKQYGQRYDLCNDHSELIVPVAVNSYLREKKSPFAENKPLNLKRPNLAGKYPEL